jgi:hypothetical protein
LERLQPMAHRNADPHGINGMHHMLSTAHIRSPPQDSASIGIRIHHHHLIFSDGGYAKCTVRGTGLDSPDEDSMHTATIIASIASSSLLMYSQQSGSLS